MKKIIPSYPIISHLVANGFPKLMKTRAVLQMYKALLLQRLTSDCDWNETRWGTSNENNPTGFPDIILYYIVLYHIILYYITLYGIISNHIILYHIILYYIILYHIISSYIISYHIILYIVCILNIYIPNIPKTRTEDWISSSTRLPHLVFIDQFSRLFRGPELSNVAPNVATDRWEPLTDSLNSGEPRHRIHMVNIGEP